MDDCRKNRDEKRESGEKYVKARIVDLPLYLDFEYTYSVHGECGALMPGMLVLVPFGGGNKKRAAIVTQTENVEEFADAKPVFSIADEKFRFSEEMLKIAEYLREHTFCSMGEAVKTVLPVGVLERYEEYYEACDINDDVKTLQMNEKTRVVYEYILSKGAVKANALIKEFGDEAKSILQSLKKSGFIEQNAKIKDARAPQNEKYSLKITQSEAENYNSRSQIQKKIVSELAKNGVASYDELCEKFPVTKAQINALYKKGVIEIIKENIYRNPYDEIFCGEEKIKLTAEQQKAYDKLYPLTTDGKPHAALLFGITGSGKTPVIKTLADEVIKSGRKVLVLVPEISLTLQTVRAFSANLGGRVAVIHSSLSAGERYDAWRKIKDGEADLVLGTRSAIFAPLENIGLIVIDEEQEHTYKSDGDPKYSARDIAKVRAAYNNSLLIFASATPSVETFYSAKSGKYTLAEMRTRFSQNELPDVIISDMRKTPPDVIIGDILRGEIAENLMRGEQTILFLNRRGYNNFISCVDCGEAILCPNCSVSLTYHTQSDSYKGKSGMLMCHYCGYRSAVPDECPSCKSSHLKFNGYGTQLIERELQESFPDAKILRMDADTTKNKFSYREILEKFKNKQADILLGTQMVTKGHDFENVTLVGVINADTSLFLDDYRANERTFSLIVQVIGRAGRAAKTGRAIIQTYNRENETIRLAAKQDFETFFNGEISMRKNLVFPPFCDIALFSFASDEESALFTTALQFAKRLDETQKSKNIPIMIFGPFEAPVYRVKNKYRMQLIVKHKNNKQSREMFRSLLCEFLKNSRKNLSISIDINPNSL